MQQHMAAIMARALVDAGAGVVTHVPGHGATEVFATFCALTQRQHALSFHEEVAYTIAHGTSLVGHRAATIIKAHGLVKAANSVLDSLAAGTTAGLLAIVCDDKTGKSSDSIFDVAAFLDGIGIPHQQGARDDIYQQVLHGFAASERLQLPYALLVDADDVHTTASFTPTPRSPRSMSYVRNVAQHCVGPLFAAYQHQVLAAKQRGDNWQAIQPPALPRIPDALPEPWPVKTQAYRPFFDIFRSLRGPLVTGDTSTPSLFALPPYNCVDLTTYMGGSIPLALGAHLAGYDPVWALTGDFSFIAAGQLGLLEAVQRGIPLKMVIFRNGRAEATGGQPIPPQLLDLILGGYTSYVRYLDNPDDGDEIRTVLTAAHAVNELCIIVADYQKQLPALER